MSTKRRGKGEGGVYRPTYRDKRTGETRQQAVWWIRYRRTRGAKETCESSGSTGPPRGVAPAGAASR